MDGEHLDDEQQGSCRPGGMPWLQEESVATSATAPAQTLRAARIEPPTTGPASPTVRGSESAAQHASSGDRTPAGPAAAVKAGAEAR